MKFVSWFFLILTCLLVAGGLGLFKYNEIQAAMERGRAFPEPVEAVETFVVRQALHQPTTRVTAELVATQSADLRNELGGRIVSVGFAPGASVAKGQLLIELDTSEERAQLAAARANEEIARLALDRAKRLVSRGAGSAEDRDRAKAQFDSAQAVVQELLATIAKKRLVAPFDATSNLHELEPGQYLTAGTVAAQLIGGGTELWVDFALPQQQAQTLMNDSVRIITESGSQINARVIARDAAINPDSRQLSFRALLPNAESKLFPGTLVSVEVPLGNASNVLVVPASAVRRNALGATVYTIEQTNETGEKTVERAVRRSVTVGAALDFDDITQQQLVIVTSGLNLGERIAANGAFKLRDGSKVKVREPGGHDTSTRTTEGGRG